MIITVLKEWKKFKNKELNKKVSKINEKLNKKNFNNKPEIIIKKKMFYKIVRYKN